MSNITRRHFFKISAAAAAYASLRPFAAGSFAKTIGANDRVRVGVVGFSDRFKSSLLP